MCGRARSGRVPELDRHRMHLLDVYSISTAMKVGSEDLPRLCGYSLISLPDPSLETLPCGEYVVSCHRFPVPNNSIANGIPSVQRLDTTLLLKWHSLLRTFRLFFRLRSSQHPSVQRVSVTDLQIRFITTTLTGLGGTTVLRWPA